MNIYATNDRVLGIRAGLGKKMIITVLQGGRFIDAQLGDLTFLEVFQKDEKTKYDELLLAVQKKYPNETRHETALRYIREREKRNNIHETLE